LLPDAMFSSSDSTRRKRFIRFSPAIARLRFAQERRPESGRQR
jgi:hypothetical protein